jgi:transcriptional regulator of nitric oxide reductase
MLLAAEGSAAYRPGIWALVALAVVLVLTVVVAKRERARQQKVVAGLPAGSWSAPCLDATSPAVKRLLIVDADGVAIAETKSGTRDSWPWDEITGVSSRSMRTRLQSNPGLRILLADGHVRDLLVYLGAGKQAYERGAVEAQAEIERRLPAAAGD